MPIDPSILGTIGQGVVKLDTPDVIAQRTLTLQEAKARRDQLIDAARQRQKAVQDDQDLQDAIRSNLGPDGLPDFSKALTTLYTKNPDVAQKLSSGLTAARKATAETDELEDKHRTAMIDLAGQAFDGATQQNWPTRYGFLAQTNQPVARMFSPQWDETTQDKIDAFKAASLKRKDAEDLNAKVREDYLAGKDDQALARQITALGPDLTPDRAVEIARTGRDKYNVDAQSASTVAELASQKKPDGTPNLDPLKAWARKSELGQKEVETLANTQARNTQLADRENALTDLGKKQQDLEVKWHAATDANEKERLKAEWTRIGLERQKMVEANTQTPEDQEKIQGYIEQLKSNPNMALTTVPAAKGMRDSVVSQLRKEGYDLSQPLTTQTRGRIEFSKAVEPQITQVRDLAKKINDLGLMGTVGGRWRSLVSGESAASSLSGLTPAQKQLVGQFVTQSGLLVSAIGVAHGGARGGGSPQLLEQLKPMLDPHNKDLDTFIGNLEGAHTVINGYVHMGDRPGATPPPATNPNAPAEGAEAPVPGHPGVVAVYRGGRWIVK